MIVEIRKRLEELAEEDYIIFNKKLMPGTDRVLGVRMPAIRQIAREVAKRDFGLYLREADAQDPSSAFHEEIMLEGLVIGYAKMELSMRFVWLDRFVPRISNWAVCDCCCSTWKFMGQYPEESFSYLQKYLDRPGEYEVRFALVSLLDYFVKEDYIDRVLSICGEVRHEGYYVKMAAAWVISVCYIKFPEKTKAFLLDNQMDPFTHNKAIQKIRESFRVSREEKEELNRLKR